MISRKKNRLSRRGKDWAYEIKISWVKLAEKEEMMWSGSGSKSDACSSQEYNILRVSIPSRRTIRKSYLLNYPRVYGEEN